MMQTHNQIFLAKPSAGLQGRIRVPGDKSISHRALIISAIAEGESILNGMLMGADNLATLKALQQLGVNIKISNSQQLHVQGVGLYGLTEPKQKLDLGNSGTGMRLLTGLLAGQAFDSVLIGDESLSRRPMKRIVKPLELMGAEIMVSDQGTPPITISGGQVLHGIEYVMPIASAQVKSCLLLAGLYANGKTIIQEPAPTRDHLERLLQVFGYPVEIKSKRVSLQGGERLQAQQIVIPADISSAAFFMVAASITPGSDVILNDVGINPTRSGIIAILKTMGANIDIFNRRDLGNEPIADIRIRYAPLRGVAISAEQVPLAIDEFPVLFIAAACAQGETILHHAAELRVKETDRIMVMANGLNNIGITAQPLSDGIRIQGGKIKEGEVDSQGDHRIAMAFAVAGCVADNEIRIHNCQNVKTSFPNFIECAHALGMIVIDLKTER